MKIIIFTISVGCIGFLAGYSAMWGQWNEDRKRIEDAPYSKKFDRLIWSARGLEEKNEKTELNPIVADLVDQAEAQETFFSELKAERIKESDPIALYAGFLIPLLGLLAFWTRPNKTQPDGVSN